MAGIFDYQAGELNQVKKMTEIILESSKGWTPKMVEWACVMAIRGTDEYQRGWEFGLKLGDDVDEAVKMEPFWAEDYEWGDPDTNYRTMSMLIKRTIEQRKADWMGEYTLAADLGRWEGYNRSLLIQGMEDEIKPVPKMLVEELVEILKEKAMKEDWREENMNNYTMPDWVYETLKNDNLQVYENFEGKVIISQVSERYREYIMTPQAIIDYLRTIRKKPVVMHPRICSLGRHVPKRDVIAVLSERIMTQLEGGE